MSYTFHFSCEPGSYAIMEGVNIMSDTRVVDPNVLVKCPGCGSEVPIGEVSLPDDQPFRCESCQQRTRERFLIHQQTQRSIEEKRRGERLPNDNVSNPSPKARRAPSRDKAAKPESVEGTMDGDELPESSDS